MINAICIIIDNHSVQRTRISRIKMSRLPGPYSRRGRNTTVLTMSSGFGRVRFYF